MPRSTAPDAAILHAPADPTGPAIMVWAGDQATTHGHGWTRGVPGYDIDSRPFTGTVYPAITRKRSAGPISVSRTFGHDPAVRLITIGSSVKH